ncbi:MAG: calcium/sodium antiporter [Candidatus Cloacimonetes bacterium]|nr:calcium/sodium antiporter [Candidatus Cloacimonadota bacterium]
MILFCLMIGSGLCLLTYGSDALVRGAEALALRMGLPPLVLGLTIVAWGTSSPELVVSIQSGLNGQPDIALGNVVGSNIFNVCVILGITALICPIAVEKQILKSDMPFMIAVSAMMVYFLNDGSLSSVESLAFIAVLFGYTTWLIVAGLKQPVVEDEGLKEALQPGTKQSVLMEIVQVVLGLVLLVAGSELLLKGSLGIARSAGLSEAIIGLTIVAAGTSMPELATSVTAALKKSPGIAIGNVVGSNIFNILGILGFTGCVLPLQAGNITVLDLGMALGSSLLLWPLLYSQSKLSRSEGVLLIGLYLGYLSWIWP